MANAIPCASCHMLQSRVRSMEEVIQACGEKLERQTKESQEREARLRAGYEAQSYFLLNKIRSLNPNIAELTKRK
jgi:DNA anti-recombination protein RmuC